MGEFERFFHRDLDAMPLEGLYREARCVQRRLDYDDKPATWLLERLQVLRHAIALRRRASTQKRPCSHAMPKGETLRTVPVEDLLPWH